VNRDKKVIPRKTSYLRDGNLPEYYEKFNKIPPF